MDKEVKNGKERLFAKLREYKYVLLVLALGLALLLLPTGGGKKDDVPEADAPAEAPEEEPLEERLEKILSLVDGAGEVRVLLTLTDDGQRVLARDSQSSAQGDRSQTSDSTVTVSRGGGVTQEVEVSYRYPLYRGAVVAAEGADSASVRLELLEAVRAATGLTADAIKIVKMAGKP